MANTYGDYLKEQQKQQSAPASGASSYGDYLKGLQTPTTPAAPQAVPTSVQSVDTYGKFLETLANNKRIENTPTNAKTYADYLTYIGQDPVGDYQAKVRQANLDYAKGLATYGQAAEKMARSGLTGGGYGEYLQGLAYQGRQSAVGAAQKDAQAAMKQTFSSYGDYLTGIKSTNEQNAINGIVNGLLEGDAAKEYARGQGVTEDRLDYVLSQTSASVGAAKAQKAQEQQALLANATSAVTSIMESGKSIDAAIASLNGVYDQTVLDQVKANLQKSNAQQAGDDIGTATGVTDFKSGLDEQLGSKAISLTDYDIQLTEGSAKNLVLINAAVDGDVSGLADYIERDYAKTKSDGTVKKSGAEVWAEMSEDDKGKQIAKWVEEIYASGNLTTGDYQSFYRDTETLSLNNAESAKELIDWRGNLDTRLANGQISQGQYDSLIEAWSGRAKAKDASITKVVFKDGGEIGISYKQGEYGKEYIKLKTKSSGLSIDSFKATAGEFESSGGSKAVFGIANGKPAMLAHGVVFYLTANNSFHNNEFLLYLLDA